MADYSVIAFDLMGTLLDLSALDNLFRAEFGSSRLRREWIDEALKIGFATTAAGQYRPFSQMTQAALKVIEERSDNHLSWGARNRILSALTEAPPFPEVNEALSQLSSSNVRLAVFTNWSRELAESALKSAGVLQNFVAVLSADGAKRLKPSPESYEYLCKKLGAKAKRVLFVAAHSWDTMGAAYAGLNTCFIARPTQVLDELAPKPDFQISNLLELVKRLGVEAKAA
ncbi:MAG TPA: haloacid dehalogenase type II [Candidatus Acidoferrales bacterium]|nr:haloacid dehalogenase type II [Candidatus Acidoferrales bacterium]